MNVEARSQNIDSVLKKGVFIIPNYQREYDWDNEEVDEFLDDIRDTPDDENYFIGHMVLEGEYNGTSFNVIDGQQRFTTITIILCALRDKFFEHAEEQLALGINDNYIFGKDRNHKEYVILQNNMPYPVLQSYVQSIPAKKDPSITPIKNGEKKIVKIYDKIKKEFDKLTVDELKVLRDKVLNLEVIFVAANDKVDAHSIFMTLNATGKDLTPIDLIKNQIFSLYPVQPHIDEPNDSWKKIIENIQDNGIKFFNNFWSSRYKKTSDKRIFKEFIKIVIKPKADVKLFLNSLLIDSTIFKKITSPKEQDRSKNKEYLIFLSLNSITQIFNIEVANAFLLALIREYLNSNISQIYLLKSLNSLEKFHFINNAICSNRSSGLDIMYAKVSRELLQAKDKHSKHKIIDEFIKKLELKIPEKSLFEAKFDSKLYFVKTRTKQKKLVQYVLNKIEFKKQNKNVSLINMTLEHIYPESPDSKWKALKNVSLTQNLGNLILLDSELNSKIGNKEFQKKQELIEKESTLISTKESLKGKTKWSDEEILERRDKLVDFLYKDIWK